MYIPTLTSIISLQFLLFYKAPLKCINPFNVVLTRLHTETCLSVIKMNTV